MSLSDLNFTYLYGFFGGLYAAACLFMLFFGASYFLDKTHRAISKTYLLYALGFFAFFLVTYAFLYTQNEYGVTGLPSWLISIAKLSVPVGLGLFSVCFVKISVMYSFVAYDVYQKNRQLMFGMLSYDAIVFVLLIFAKNKNEIVYLSLVNFIPHLLLTTWYVYVVFRNLLGQILTFFFAIGLFGSIAGAFMAYAGHYQLASWLVLTLLAFFSLLIMMLSFGSIRYSYFELLKYHAVKQRDTHGLMDDILFSIRKNHFFMVYQPLVSPATNQLISMEALIRWNHPRHGLVSPVEFIQTAEQTGLIQPLCRWIISSVLKQQQIWINKGIRVPVAINFSVINLTHEMCAFLLDEAERYDVPPQLINIEITESLFLDINSDVLSVLRKLHYAGITIAIDDYGTGFSSLSYIKEPLLSELKIDRSFIFGLDKNEGNRVIVKTIIQMCQGLGIRVTAEGVEDASTIKVLADMQCDKIQGYEISQPLSADEITRWATANASRSWSKRT